MHAVFQDDYSMFFLLEFVPGGEMFSYLRRMGNFDTSLARFYAVEIICALYAMHELKIAYRDIKPENILIDKLGHIRLVDFGFAKIVEDRTYTLCGTPEYLAPEVIKGSGHGLGVDYWSLGVLVYEMSVGYPPFYGDNPFTVYQRILEAQVNYPPTGVADAEGLSKPMQSLVSGLLTPNRTTRLGCGAGGIYKLKKHAYFKGVDWYAASKMLIMPPLVPSVSTDGDTSNFDIYPDEIVEEQANLTSTQREEFMRLDELIDRIPSAM
jgi:protein kinase X